MFAVVYGCLNLQMFFCFLSRWHYVLFMALFWSPWNNPSTAHSGSPSPLFVFIVWRECVHTEHAVQHCNAMAYVSTEQGRGIWASVPPLALLRSARLKTLSAWNHYKRITDRETTALPLASPPQWHWEDKLTERGTEACTHWLWRDEHRVTSMLPRESFFGVLDWILRGD